MKINSHYSRPLVCAPNESTSLAKLHFCLCHVLCAHPKSLDYWFTTKHLSTRWSQPLGFFSSPPLEIGTSSSQRRVSNNTTSCALTALLLFPLALANSFPFAWWLTSVCNYGSFLFSSRGCFPLLVGVISDGIWTSSFVTTSALSRPHF